MIKDVGVFKKNIGSAKEEAVLGNIFWSCSSTFGPLKRKPGSKRLFLFTNNDEPQRDNVSLQRAAKIRARDLTDLGILIELFELGHGFDLSRFYADILPVPVDDEDAETFSTSHTASSSEKFSELMAKVRRRESRKRALGKMSFELGEGMSMAIRVYSLYMEAKKGQYVWMDEASGKLAKPLTQWLDSSTGGTVSRQELSFYYDFGGEKAVFTQSELVQVKDLGKPGLKIVGFRPASWLKPYHNVTHSSFIFPDETEVHGSIVAFRALLDGLLETDQIAICSYIARRTVAPRIVALLPQKEAIDPDTGVQTKPNGMHLIFLPFAEELRNPSQEVEFTPAEPELVDKAKEIIGKLTISGGFDPEAFENPVLQRHYAALQALALDQELDEEDTKDSVMPDFNRIQKRAGPLIEEFISMIPALNEQPEKAEKAPRKRASAEDTDVASIAHDADKLARLTMPVLKEYAQTIGIKPARLKAELVNQIVESCPKAK